MTLDTPGLCVIEGPTMGTSFKVAFAAAPGLDESVLAQSLQAAVDDVDLQMSTWNLQSALSRFNAVAVGQWCETPTALALVVGEGLEISRATSGAFDMTVGALVDLWGFGPQGIGPLPDAVAIASAYAEVGYERLKVRADPPGLLKEADFKLDLSGIAKGYGVDQLAATLEGAGIFDFLVGIDGEVCASGRKPPRGDWFVAVEAPFPGVREAWDILAPKNCALATSGDYRRFRTHDGHSYAHTIDPRTGRPVRNGLGSVTVAHRQCMIADAWATALLALGPDAGVELARERDIAALFLVRGAGGISEIVTGDFAAAIE